MRRARASRARRIGHARARRPLAAPATLRDHASRCAIAARGDTVFGLRERRRRRLRAGPFPDDWRRIVEQRFPLFARLPEADRSELLGHIRVFLDEKKFEGCGGLTITDEIRVVIAAQACLLLLHREPHYYPRLVSILVYPHAYVAQGRERLPGGIVAEQASGRLGESWVEDLVVLAWDAVRAGASDANDGHNVVLHEFAHQLDQEDGTSNGAPILEHRSQYVAWARILGGAFDALQHAVEHGRATDIDPYGATNPAEFFAVVSEAFFERPAALQKRHPELYDELKLFYRQDPLAFAAPS
jgi:Mlc titration factor MtfA (ptsG expression regulator)